MKKYWMCMKRAQEGLQSTGSNYGTNLTTHFKGAFFPTSPSAPNFNSCLPHLEASTSTSNLGHPYGRNVSSLDAIAQNNKIFLDFGTSQFTPQTGRTQVDPGYVPRGLVSNINSKTILSSIESTGSLGNPNRTPRSYTVSTYVGYRLSVR